MHYHLIGICGTAMASLAGMLRFHNNLLTLRDYVFLSLKATDIIARRESPGKSLKRIPSLKATNNSTPIVARLQRAAH